MPSRREFLIMTACTAASPGLAAPSSRMRRIGWLTAQQPSSLTPYLEALQEKLIAANHDEIAIAGSGSLDLRVSAGELIAGPTQFANTALWATMGGGKLSIDLGEAHAYGGQGEAKLTAAMTDAGLTAKLTAQFDGITAAGPLGDYLGIAALSGTGSCSVEFATAGRTWHDIAHGLAGHAKVTRVIHPTLAQGRAADLAAKYLPRGAGGLVGFELAGGAQAGRAFIDGLKLFYHVANIGDARSLAIHPASTTHSQLSEAEQAAAGVSPGYVRLSIGIEHIDDILADLDQALAGV